MNEELKKKYWRANLRLVGYLMSIWFFVSYILSIAIREPLDEIRLGGFGLGFWFAQQGSIYVFVVLIFFYMWRMNIIDKRFNVDE